MQPATTNSDKWKLRRKELMQNQTYRAMINRIEGDAEMFHRIRLATLMEKTHPGIKYCPLRIERWEKSSGLKRIIRLRGLCYVMAEAIYHNGGEEAGYRPYRATWWGISHWWLQNAQGRAIDPTADQFKELFPYWRGKPAGFLTKRPSARTELLMTTLDRIRFGK